MRKIRVSVPHPEVYGASVEHVIEVEDDYAKRMVGAGQGVYVDEPVATDVDASAAEPQPVDGDPATRVRRATKVDAPAE